ncbi:MAG: EI24 domain-containing protein [Parvicellaceae bacterium]
MKKIIKQFSAGFGSYSQATSFIFKHGLWYYFLFPLVLNLLIFFGGISLINSLTDQSIDWAMNSLNNFNSTGFWGTALEWTRDSLGWIIWLIFKIAFFYIFLIFGGYLSLIALSPILAFLSEKTEEIVSGTKNPFNILQFTRDIIRAILIVVRNMTIQSLWVFLFFIISFLPIIGWIVSFFGNLIISSYFYGFSFMDYTNERRKLKLKESVLHIKENKGLATGLGLPFVLCFLVPFLGSIIASFIAVISVVAASLCMIEKEKASALPEELNA